MEKSFLIPLDNQIIKPYFFLLLLCGIYVSYKLRFPQFRFLLLALKIFSGAMDHKGSRGQLVHSQAFYAGNGSSLLIGATLGSIFAMMIGGVGSLFWIWLFTFLIMPIKIVSSTMAIKFRTKLPNGRYLSGPMYFIEKALKARWLAIAFALGSLLTVLSMGGVVPVLTMTYLAKNVYGLKGLMMPLLVSAFLIYVVIGGIRRVGRVAGYFAPISIILFFVSFLLFFGNELVGFGSFLSAVFQNAFSIDSAAKGGAIVSIGTLFEALGIFFISTETGLGKNAGISGVVRTDAAVKQGLVSMLSSFIEGVIVSTLIFYVLYSYAVFNMEQQENFLNLFLSSSKSFSGFLFILSFILFWLVGVCGWFYTGEQNAYYIHGEKFANFFRILFIVSVLLVSFLFIRFGEKVIFHSYYFGYTMAIFSAIPILITQILLAKGVGFELNKFIKESGLRYEIIKDFYIILLSILPKNFLSYIFGLITRIRLPRFMMIPILKAFAWMYKINVNEAELNLWEYNSLNQFFTRALKAEARIIDSAENAIVSPVDARIIHFGDISQSTLLQAKGINYSLKELLGSEKYYPYFKNGKFITFYLSPQDYHRIHSPFNGRILGYYYEPGKLFPVNDLAALKITGLYPKNERLITFIQTEYGKIAVVKVGASNVGKIRVTYDMNIVTNSWIRLSREVDYDNVDIMIQKGAELGRFEMGSTVILVFETDTVDLVNIVKDEKQTYGSTVALFRNVVC